MIKHSVVFKLKHGKGSAGEKAFIAATQSLSRLPGVQNLEVLRQISPKAPYTFALFMDFVSQPAYDAYMKHPDHVAYTRDRWDEEVTDFMIIDYTPLGRSPLPRPRPGGARKG